MNTINSSMGKAMANNMKDKKGKPEVKKKQMVVTSRDPEEGKPTPAILKGGMTNAAKVAKAAGVPKKPINSLTMKQPEEQRNVPKKSLTQQFKERAQEARFGPDGDIENPNMKQGIVPADFMGGMFQKPEPPKNAQEKRQQKRVSPFWTCGSSWHRRVPIHFQERQHELRGFVRRVSSCSKVRPFLWSHPSWS